MESIAPPLECLYSVKRALECGESVRSGLNAYLALAQDSEFRNQVNRWLMNLDHDLSIEDTLRDIRSLYRRSLLKLLQMGLRGAAVYEQLIQIEEEIQKACEHELQKRVDLLPFQFLVPLLFFMFPAFLILLLGPILSQFVAGFR